VRVVMPGWSDRLGRQGFRSLVQHDVPEHNCSPRQTDGPRRETVRRGPGRAGKPANCAPGDGRGLRTVYAVSLVGTPVNRAVTADRRVEPPGQKEPRHDTNPGRAERNPGR
jgi:hypothetical protein